MMSVLLTGVGAGVGERVGAGVGSAVGTWQQMHTSVSTNAHQYCVRVHAHAKEMIPNGS